MVTWLIVSARERLGAAPVAAAARPSGCVRRPDLLPARGAGGWSWRSSSSRGHPESSFHVLLVAVGVLRAAAVAGAPLGGAGRRRWRGRCWPSAARSRAGGARGRQPDAVRRAAAGARPTSSTGAGHRSTCTLAAQGRARRCSCPTTGGARRRRRSGRSCSSAPCYVGALPLMLAAAALILRPTRRARRRSRCSARSGWPCCSGSRRSCRSSRDCRCSARGTTRG